MRGWTEEGITRAWRALTQQVANEEWRLVNLCQIGDVAVEAGCQFPLELEALVLSFPGGRSAVLDSLPDCQGFDVVRLKSHARFSKGVAIAIVRRTAGSLDLFAIMVIDILRTLEHTKADIKRDPLTVFLDRVREWQAFMARSHKPLSADAQTGLFGELWLLRLLTQTALASSALECWQGPLHAAQDFHIRDGAIEVKSTVRSSGFPARINSVEQLDAERCPLVLAALRFKEAVDGISLEELVKELRRLFEGAGLRRGFDAMLLIVGYLDEHAHLYGRKLVISDGKAFVVNDGFPRLTRAGLPTAVRSAAYVLDLQVVEATHVNLPALFNEFGLQCHELG